MPNAQSDYPLTLAEVLFEELETTCADIDKPEIEIEVVFTEVESRGLALIRAICRENDWDDVEERIEEIRSLPALGRKEIERICERERIEVDLADSELFDVIWKCKKELGARLVPVLYEISRKLPNRRSALCLSGGGIRSATFNLGILQGLARYGLLEKFDYLSTVSGGGFIGGWLTAWIHREEDLQPGQLPVSKVAAMLADPPDDPLKPEPDPVYNLRVYANYLTPRKGLLSVDTWTLAAVYLRNLLLNWMVFVPAIIAGLMLPRIWVAFVKGAHLSPTILLWTGFAGALIALIYIGVNLPGAKQLNLGESSFVALCLTPLVISAMALTTYWVRLPQSQQPAWWEFGLFALVLGAVPWTLYVILRIIARLREGKGDDHERVRRPGGWALTVGLYVSATVLILIAFALTGLVTWYVVTHQLPTPLNLQAGYARIYASLAVPVLLVLLTVGGTLIAGFTSRFTDVDDQEWWARSGAWILIVVVSWSVFHLLVLFGPTLFVEMQTQLVNNQNWTSWSGVKGIGTALVGIVSGAITLLGGSGAKTSAHGDSPAESKSSLVPIVTAVAAVIFAAFLLILLALATNWILASVLGEWAGKLLGATPSPLNANDPRAIIYQTPGRVLVVLAVLIAVVGWILGRFINTNRFSLHYYWRNRLMRAYLGASRKRAKTKNKFTDFDSDDNVQMYELKQKPLHVVNVTLNLAGGDKLEWQDRKAESFAISPLHAGSYWLGYRNSRHYGGPGGISLATSAAISGAAASPNMGYMMTSPVVRFIMTLFNVRLGFWLGNPGVAGSGDSTTFNRPTFDRDSPTQSVRPIFAEALGMTDSQSPYIYLSDGGHFDNLGLYEMILRRCRFIVVTDASTDPNYHFESLAYSIRQIRVDFGVPIEMGEMNLGKDPDKENKYCAIGTIRYSCVDRPLGSTEPDEDFDGVLIYVKPSLNGSEPADVLNYHKGDNAFPQDTIADQWFSESQFESYRMLGSHMIHTICPDKLGAAPAPFENFAERVRAHLVPTP
jgi:hypothetical protein